MNRSFSFSAILLAAAVVVASGCDFKLASDGGGQDEPKPSQDKVKVTTVAAGDLKHETILAASVEGYETAELMSKIDGYVDVVRVDIGDPIKKGQNLATIRAPELGDEVTRREKLLLQADEDAKIAHAGIALAVARLDEQKERLRLSQIKLQRTRSLVSQGALKQEKLDEADATVRANNASIRSATAEVNASQAAYKGALAHMDVAAAEVDKAKSLASYRGIDAPFDGIVIARAVDPGDLVSDGGTSLLTVAQIDRVRVIVYLPMDQATKLDRTDPVALHDLASAPGATIKILSEKPLTISRFTNAFDQRSRMMRAEIDVDNVALKKEMGVELKIGDYGKASVLLHDYTKKPTVLASAVGKNNNGSYVVVFENNMGKEVEVRPLYTKEVQKGDEKIKYTVLEDMEGSVKIGDKVAVEDLASVPRGKTLLVEESK